MNFFKNDIFFGAIAAILLWITLIYIYTPSRPAAVFAGVVAASAIAGWAYSRQSWRSRGGVRLLLLCAALLGSGVILNCWYFTTACGATDAAPLFQNFDADLNWEYYTMSNLDNLATDSCPGLCFNRASGYPYLMWLISLPTGPSLALLLGVNMLCVLLTIILCGSITRICLRGSRFDSPVAPAFCAMIVLASNCYFMVTATIFIKDAVTQFLFASMTYMLLAIRLGLWKTGRAVAASFGLMLLIALVRHQLIPLMIPGFILLLWGRKHLRPLLAITIFSAAVYAFIMMLPTHEEYDMTFSILSGPRTTHPEKLTTFIVDNSRTDLIYSITGNLDEQMPWMRLLWLPLTMLCQFLIPFPWNFTRDIIFGPTQFYAHIAYPGYLAGILLGYYILFMMRRGPQLVNIILCWGAMLYAAVAFHWSGSVSRYCLMFIPLATPAISCCLLGAYRRHSLYIWTAICAIILAAGLIVCYRLSH